MPASWKVELAMVDHDMKIPATTAMPKNGKSITITPKGALMKGAYEIVRSVGRRPVAGGHKINGEFAFKVG